MFYIQFAFPYKKAGVLYAIIFIKSENLCKSMLNPAL